MAEMKERQEREEDDKLKTLSPKERDEWRKSKSKPTGASNIVKRLNTVDR